MKSVLILLFYNISTNKYLLFSGGCSGETQERGEKEKRRENYCQGEKGVFQIE